MSECDRSSREVLTSVVSECDRESSIMRRPRTTGGCCIMGKKLREKKCACGVFVVTLEEMRSIGISKCMGENNTKMYLKYVGWEHMHIIDVV